MPKRSCFTMIVLSLMTAAGLVGCSAGGGGDGSGSSSGTNDVSAIAGLWDTSQTTDGLEDKRYMQIHSSGKVTWYNFLGDAYDRAYSDWGDCYLIQRDYTPQITKVNGDSYLITTFDVWYNINSSGPDKTYNIDKDSPKTGTLTEIHKNETLVEIFTSENKLILSSNGETQILTKASKTLNEMESYSRCPYSD